MTFFRELEPGIHIGTAAALCSEEDGRQWTQEYDSLLATEKPFVVIANVKHRPQPAAGKPMAIWLKARRAALAQLVRLTVYVAEDEEERRDLERTVAARMKSSPYPLSAAATEADAIQLARAALS